MRTPDSSSRYTSTIGQRDFFQLPRDQLQGGQRVSLATTTYNAGLTQNLPWYGGNFLLTWTNFRRDSSSLFASFNPTYETALTAHLVREEAADNAIRQADTPSFDRLMQGPHALLRTSGLDVGLPPGQMGNSEVGHLNLGAGRVVMQDLPRIDAAVADGSLAAVS